MKMNKLLLKIVLGLGIISGSAFAQTSPEGGIRNPIGVPGDRPTRPSGPSVPSLVRDNDQVKVFAAEFNASRETFRSRLDAMKRALQEAPESQKMLKREQIRQLLIDHRATQIEFRKNLRQVSKDFRDEKLVKDTGP